MKKIIMALGLAGLLAGCASHENSTGGTSDQNNNSNGQYNNTPTQTAPATNMNNSGQPQ